MTADILAPTLDSHVSVVVSQSPQKELTPEVVNLLEKVKYWETYFRRDDKMRAIGFRKRSYGKVWQERSAINNVLLPFGLDEVHIPKDGPGFENICMEIAGELLKRSPEAFKGWVEYHNEPIEWKADHNDPRVIGISLAAQKLIGLEKLKDIA